MTNMLPQVLKNNRETWANLEDYTRDLVKGRNEVYMIMGCYSNGGTGSNGKKEAIDAGRVTVPTQIWKVLVILPEGNDDLSWIISGTRVIAVNTPNSNSVRPDWGSYRTSVDAIKKQTNYDLLPGLPSQIQATVESKTENGSTQ